MWSIIELGLQKGLNAYADPDGEGANYHWWTTVNGNWNCVSFCCPIGPPSPLCALRPLFSTPYSSPRSISLTLMSSLPQVCNNGLITGALAIANEDPTGIAARVLEYAVANAAGNCAMSPSSDGTWSETANYVRSPSPLILLKLFRGSTKRFEGTPNKLADPSSSFPLSSRHSRPLP